MTVFQFRHTPQRTDNDCAIATVAAVSGLRYETVAAMARRKNITGRCTPFMVRELLQGATRIDWRPPKLVYQPLRTLSFARQPIVLFIRQPGWWWNFFRTQHCILVHDGDVSDPGFDWVVSIREYSRANWMPTLAFQPVNYDSLARAQRNNHFGRKLILRWKPDTFVERNTNIKPPFHC